MTTRQGTIYNNMANPNEDPLSNLTQQVAQILELVQTMNLRINTLEQGQTQRTQSIVTNDNQDKNDRDTSRDD